MSSIDYKASKTVADFMKSEAFFRILQGPIGGGKSVGCVMEILRQAMQMPPCKDGVRRSRAIIVRNTGQQLKDTTIKTFMDWIKPGILGRWVASEMTFQMRFNDVECDVLFRQLNSPEDVQRVLSLEGTFAWINEAREIPLEIVEALMGRIGRYPKRDEVPEYRSFLLADTNPPETDSVWFKIAEGLPLEEDNPNSIMQCDSFKQPSGLSEEAENKEFLRPNYYEDLAIGKTRAWVDTYIHGLYSPSQAGKPVYKDTFRADKHVSSLIKPDFDLPVVIGFDTGLTPAFVFKIMGLDGRVKVLKELALFDMGMKRACKQHVRPLLKNFFPNNQWIFIGDPAGNRRADSDESTAFQTIKEEFAPEGAIVKAASTNDPSVRIQATEQMLCQYPDGDPLMTIHPDCKWYLEGLRSKYRYAKLKMSGKFADKPEKNEWSHVVEAGQYCDLYLHGGKFDPRDYIKSRADADPFGFYETKPYRPAQSHGY